ncbi:MAG: hypothetical protein QGF56_10095, partial [Verrucomicrobiota bacterium]|nr:hypothetical protein [Verrucomicrobiota bacterium]
RPPLDGLSCFVCVAFFRNHRLAKRHKQQSCGEGELPKTLQESLALSLSPALSRWERGTIQSSLDIPCSVLNIGFVFVV